MNCTLIVTQDGADYSINHDGVANVKLFHPRQNGYWANQVDLTMNIPPTDDLCNYDLVVCRAMLDITIEAMEQIEKDVEAGLYEPALTYLEIDNVF